MFVRFVVGIEGEHHRSLTGIITESRLLRDTGVLTQDEDRWLEEVYEWFNANLPLPPFSDRSFPEHAACWFRDDAGDAIRKMRELAAFLTQHGVSVRMLRARNPGKILYEDSYQIVVKEFKRLE